MKGNRGPAELVLLAMLLLGCGEVAPIGRRPASDQFLTQVRFAAQVLPGSTREAVRQRFGEPFAARPDGRAVAYCRTETAERQILTLAVIVPFWSKAQVTYFQIQGIWFDAEGKVSQTRLWNGHDGPHGGNPYQPYCVPNQEQILLWLEQEAPGTGQ